MDSMDSFSSVNNVSPKSLNKPQTTVIKVSNKYLHKNGIGIMKNTIYHVQEDIIQEANILNILTCCNNAPKSIVKYCNFFRR